VNSASFQLHYYKLFQKQANFIYLTPLIFRQFFHTNCLVVIMQFNDCKFVTQTFQSKVLQVPCFICWTTTNGKPELQYAHHHRVMSSEQTNDELNEGLQTHDEQLRELQTHNKPVNI